jgi:hypothetical protein
MAALEAVVEEVNEAGLAENWEAEKTTEPLHSAGLDIEYPDVWTNVAVDLGKKAVTVYYSEAADPDRVSGFLARLEAVTAALPWPVSAEPAPLSGDELNATASQILAASDEWADRLGIEDIVWVGPDPTFSVMQIGTSQTDPPRLDLEINGIPLEVIGESGVELQASL